jgi:hypothetical protein
MKGQSAMPKLAKVCKSASRPRRDPLQRDNLARLDDDFVLLQQASLSKRSSTKTNRKLRKPVSKEELDESLEMLSALLCSPS